MANRKLSDEVIAARMVELRNLRKLHSHDRQQIVELKAENKAIRAENVELRQIVSTLQIQMAELQTMVFGKKKKAKLPPDDGTPSSGIPAQPRTPESYRRPLPPASTITAEAVVPLPDYCACGGSFDPDSVTTHIRYQEDIPLPELTPNYQPHLVTKYVVERGTCLACGSSASGKDLGGAQVSLGPNVRLLVCHLISVVGMSYAQVAALLSALYGLRVTDGEIASILHKQHEAWLPAYNRLKADIRAAPAVHLDETPWPIQHNDRLGHAWVLADAHTPKVCFALENSRGAVHAKALVGEAYHGIRVSDDYGAYRSLSGTQQLCWAHLYRCIRDLRYNDNLSEAQLPYVRQWYESFAAVYQDLRQYLDEPYDEVVRATQASELWERVQALANGNPGKNSEPDKLTRLKVQLLRAGKDRLFVCLAKNTPCDNNRAERELRQLVLKRKRSLGSKSERGATALATVLSLCTTAWRTAPTSYFSTLASLAG